MGNLKIDLYRRPAGWDYVTLDVPGQSQPMAVYVRTAARGHIQLLFSGPREIRVTNHPLGHGGLRKP